MLSQSLASSLLCWSCTHWLKRVASVISDVPLSVATLRAESCALIRVLRSARLRHASLTWLLSPPLARATNDRPAVIFQPSNNNTCSAIPLEHRHVSSQLGPGGLVSYPALIYTWGDRLQYAPREGNLVLHHN